jgi:putative ABC transport system permease protein
MDATSSLQTLGKDVRLGIRLLIKNRRFALVGILTLALGIGASTAIYSVVNAVVLRQLPFEDPQRVVSFLSRVPNFNQRPFSLPDFMDYRENNQSLEGISAITDWAANLTGRGDAERLQGVRISANAFQLLGVHAHLGRTLLPEDDRPDRPLVAVLTYGLWKRRFAGDLGIIGQTLQMSSETYTIVGVLPDNFAFPYYRAEVARPLRPDSDPRRLDRGSISFLRGIGRLKPGVTPNQAQAQFTALAERLREQYPDSNRSKLGVTIVPLQELIVGNFQLILLVLAAAVALVLLIACINMATLVLSKSSERHREIAIRIAFGASRARIMRQLLTENVILSLLGGMAGYVLAMVAVPSLLVLSPPNLPRVNEIRVDGSVLVFTMLISVVSGLLFGLIPALQHFEKDLNGALKEEEKGSSGSRARRRSQGLVVVAEVGFSLVLLVSTGLLLRSLKNLERVSLGFVSDHVLTLRLSMPQVRYKTINEIVPFAQQVRLQMESLPGVESVGTTSSLPMSGVLGGVYFSIVGQAPAPGKELPVANYRMVSPGYLHVMRVPLLQGREFTEQDTKENAGVGVINQTMANQFWPNGGAVGSHISIDDVKDFRTLEIVGVAADVREESLDSAPNSEVFVPMKQVPQDLVPFLAMNQFWVLRTSGDPMLLARQAQQVIKSQDNEVSAETKPMDGYLAASVAPRRFNLLLLEIFSGTALVMTVIGIYGVMANLVSQRYREISIRIALGASRSAISRLVLLQGFKLVAAGVAVGLLATFLATHFLENMLFGVSATDPLTYFVVVLSMGIIAGLVCDIQRARVTKIDPMVLLRQQ